MTTSKIVTGQWTTVGGAACAGYVSFRPSVTDNIVDLSGAVVLTPDPIRAALDDDGKISVSLLCCDDSTIEPAGWVWVVTENVRSGVLSRAAYSVTLSVDDASTVDLSDLDRLSLPVGVLSVNGETGQAIVLDAADVGAPAS